jgi:hypothetical protein
MRWKLLRRRLSVSAPRVIVRSHLPWPLRWAVAAVVLGFSGALALWAFETGKTLAGVDADARDELQRLRVEVQGLREERDRAQSIANAADGLLKAERAAQDRLADELRAAQEREKALEADLAFFERLLPAADDRALQVRALQAEPIAPGQTRYLLLLMQPGRAPAPFEGRYDVVLSGRLEGRSWSTGLPGGAQPLRLRQYLRLEGVVDHPPGVVLKTVQARITDGAGGLKASETLTIR